MSGKDQLELFKSASSQWLCDPYSVEIRYIAKKENNNTTKILSCSITFFPIPWSNSNQVEVSTNQILAGKKQISNISLKVLKDILEKLEHGKLSLENLELSLETKSEPSYYTEMISNDRWFCDAHLLILGDALDPFSSVEIAKLNSELRLGKIPFDGINDLLDSFNLPDCISAYKQPQIEIRIFPPIDLISNQCHTSNSKFHLVLNAHPSLGLPLV